MAFRNLTNSGKEYLATRLANELPVKFTKAKIGNGSIPLSTNPAQTTELYGFKKQVTILKTVQEQNSIKLTIQITNDGVNEGFYLKEIGIYVDDNGKEVLYWYCNEDNSQYINAQADTPLSFEVDIMMEVTNVDSVVVEWSGKDTWVNKALLKEEMAKKLDKGAVSTEYDTAAKIEAKIKEAKNTADNKLTKGSLPAEITDAKGIYDLIENNSGLNFDPNLLFLNDAGTKTQDKIYFDRNKKGLFRCTQTTTTTTNSTTYFEDISNKSSADRLTKLGNFKILKEEQEYFKVYTYGNFLFVSIRDWSLTFNQILYALPSNIKIKEAVSFSCSGGGTSGVVTIGKSNVVSYVNGKSLSGLGIAVIE